MLPTAAFIAGAAALVAVVGLLALLRIERHARLAGSAAQVSFALNSLLVMAVVFGVLFALLTWVVPYID